MQSTSTTRRTAIVLAVVTAIALVGCSAPDTADDGLESSDGPTVVEIALAVPLTAGDTEAGLDMRRAAELAMTDVNNSSDVDAAGLQLVLTVVDDKDDLETAFAEAQLIVADERVIGVIGHPSSDVTLFVSSVYDDADLPFVAVASSPLVTERGYGSIARILPREDAAGARAGFLARDVLEATSAVVVADGTFHSDLAADAFEASFVDAGGVVLAREDDAGSETADVISSIATLGPGVVFVSTAVEDAAALSVACREAGSDAPFAVEGACSRSDYLELAGASAEGDLGVRTVPDLEGQARGRDFLAYFETTHGYTPRPCAAYAYDGVWVLARAVLEVGVDRVAVSRALRTMEFSGVTGTMRFDERGDTTNLDLSAHRVVDGEWVSIP